MAEQGDALCGAPEEPQPAGVTLSDSLISTRTRSAGPLPTGTLRLDRENISCIGKSRGQEGIHSLYLQQNQIEKLENLECFPNLRFLCLAGNRIQRVQNLQGLLQLSLLDLSHNLIQVLHTEELPRSLRILDLAGNQCTQQEGYRDGVLAALPRLLQLDSQPVRASFLGDLRRELAGRARLRRALSLEEHRARLEELRELLGAGQGGTARPGPQRCPQGRPGAPLAPLRAPSGSRQPPGQALQRESRAKGAGNGLQVPQTPCSSQE
ncbi:leucine-rich repeat-containing protein 46 [Ammospiza nelsoni]|uniref:leucine-rich repeat-containing protein 46 n=1 Tax=Ammospiza nelsoni TaxID=2857394 RepID=UPI00286A67E0|nr:leucine-rich repeat-containing protein 46 [Ammospiza nelsoni]